MECGNEYQQRISIGNNSQQSEKEKESRLHIRWISLFQKEMID
jgi:hypothetical protein